MAVAKHFPGLGRTSLDPHHELPIIELDEKEMQEINLPPFRSAVEAGVSGIMTSHAIYPLLEPERSATLSPRILNGLLRETLAYQGLIITDDLEISVIRCQPSVLDRYDGDLTAAQNETSGGLFTPVTGITDNPDLQGLPSRNDDA